MLNRRFLRFGGIVARFLFLGFFILGSANLPAFAALVSPDDYLGFHLGADRKLATWDQVVGYFRLLARNSKRVVFEEIGRSTMGNPMVLVIVSSEKNIARLDKYRAINDRLADPRGLSEKEAARLIDEGKVIYLLNATIHSDEVSNTQMTLKLAYELARAKSGELTDILSNVILLIVPSQNPDGQKMVIDWYNRHLGTKYEGGPMPWLYHKYVGHDTNRDWFMFTQKETRVCVEQVYNKWHPQITHDMHQSGWLEPRLFVPPYKDPYDPNIDPILVSETARMGTSILARLTAEGKRGVLVASLYDLWTPARAYMVYHGSIRLLSEIASCRIATPVDVTPAELKTQVSDDYDPFKPSWKQPLPFTGGRWSLSDMIDYGYSATVAALTQAARYRSDWLRNFYLVGLRAVSPKRDPHAFVIPATQRDPVSLSELLWILKFAQVEIHRSRKPFTADGKRFEAGSYVVYLAQPYGAFAKTMLEVQHYPDLRRWKGGPPIPPYDMVGHTLGYQLGVRTVQINEPFTADLEPVAEIKPPPGKLTGTHRPSWYLFRHESNAAFKLMNELLKKGIAITWSDSSFKMGERDFPAGTVIVPAADNLDRDWLARKAGEFSVDVTGVAGHPPAGGMKIPPHPVKLALYKPWVPSIDEGWTRFILEEYGFKYESLTNERINRGKLRDSFDVILFPDIGRQTILEGFSKGEVPARYAGGLKGKGEKAIRDFVLAGGTAIAISHSSSFLMKALRLPVKNCLAGLKSGEFFCPGSILLSRFDTGSPIAYGMPEKAAVFFRRSPAFIPRLDPEKKLQVIGKYPDVDLLMSGWVLGQEHLGRRANLVKIDVGNGSVILIGFNVQHRAQFRSTYKILFNSIYYGSARAAGVNLSGRNR